MADFEVVLRVWVSARIASEVSQNWFPFDERGGEEGWLCHTVSSMASAKIVNFPFLREGLRKMVFGELSISLIDHETSSVEMMSDLTMH